MIRSNVVLAVVLGAALAGCQRAPQQAAASPSPSAPASTPYSARARRARHGGAGRARMRPGACRARARRRKKSTTASKPASRPSERVERIDRAPAAEPIDIPADEARREPAAAPEPEIAREARPERLSIPAGTELQLVLENDLSSSTSHVGDPVTARVSRATGPDGDVVLPGGTVLKGRVYRADAAGRVKGRSRLSVDFDRITVRGVEHRLDTTAIDVEGPDSHGRDAAIIGGSTVGGAIVGGILGGGSGAKKGAVVGAVGGTGAVLATKGQGRRDPVRLEVDGAGQGPRRDLISQGGTHASPRWVFASPPETPSHVAAAMRRRRALRSACPDAPRAHRACSRTMGSSSAASRSRIGPAARVAGVAQRHRDVAQQAAALGPLDGAPAKPRARNAVLVEGGQRIEVRRHQPLAGREVSAGPCSSPSPVPRAHVLADVAAEHVAADGRAVLVRDRALDLDREVADAAARVEHVGRDQSAGGAGVQARGAGPAHVGARRVRLHLQVGDDLAEEEPRAVLGMQQTGVLAPRPQAGGGGVGALHDRSGVHVDARLHRAQLGDQARRGGPPGAP